MSAAYLSQLLVLGTRLNGLKVLVLGNVHVNELNEAAEVIERRKVDFNRSYIDEGLVK